MRLGCLGGNIGGFYRFGLGDVSGTPSLGINLKDKLDLRKSLEENTNRQSIPLSAHLHAQRKPKEGKTQKNKGKTTEFERELLGLSCVFGN